jgi:hypothetical protein
LWAASVQLVDSATVSTSSINWTTASIRAEGYAGTNGATGADGYQVVSVLPVCQATPRLLPGLLQLQVVRHSLAAHNQQLHGALLQHGALQTLTHPAPIPCINQMVFTTHLPIKHLGVRHTLAVLKLARCLLLVQTQAV